MSSQERRLAASRLRPTITRTSVLNALEAAAPSCLDARQMHRILSKQFDSVTLSSIYRALKDLWGAGLLVRTEGAHGRGVYTIKPDGPDARYDTLRCHCGARLVFIKDEVLREHLRLVASEEGFDPDKEAAYTITMNCAKCRQSRKGER